MGLNTFNPQETTPNTKQRGTLLSISEQATFHNQSFLSSLLAYKAFSFEVFGQGSKPLTLLPDQNLGNYFADTRRSARRWQWQEQYFARTMKLFGQHSFKLGGDLDYTYLSGQFNFRPIEIRRRDQTLTQRIDFIGPTRINRSLLELGAFIQDRWVINPACASCCRWNDKDDGATPSVSSSRMSSRRARCGSFSTRGKPSRRWRGIWTCCARRLSSG